MALNSYANLKTAIAGWLARDDLTSAIDDFIDLAEARINRELRVSDMITAFSDTIASGVVAVPTGFLEWESVYIDGSPVRHLQAKPLDWILSEYPSRSSDSQPRYIARSGDNFEFGPYPDSAYTVKGSYYAKLTPLGDGTGGTATTNYLTDEAPDVILFGALVESAPYLGEDARISLWEQRFSGAIADCNARDKLSRLSSRMSLTMSAR